MKGNILFVSTKKTIVLSPKGLLSKILWRFITLDREVKVNPHKIRGEHISFAIVDEAEYLK